MVIPDFELICEIMLVAEGFIDARLLARKFISLYTLCKELLSKQVNDSPAFTNPYVEHVMCLLEMCVEVRGTVSFSWSTVMLLSSLFSRDARYTSSPRVNCTITVGNP